MDYDALRSAGAAALLVYADGIAQAKGVALKARVWDNGNPLSSTGEHTLALETRTLSVTRGVDDTQLIAVGLGQDDRGARSTVREMIAELAAEK